MRVEYADCWFDFGERHERPEYVVACYGRLVSELDADVLEIAHETHPDGERAITHVPRAYIRSVKTYVPEA